MQPIEKNSPPGKFSNFGTNGVTNLPSPRSPLSASNCNISSPDHSSRYDADQEFSSPSISNGRNVEQVSEDIDGLGPDQVPDTVETISKIIESRIAKYNNSGETTTRNRPKKMTEEDAFFIEAVMRISKLSNANVLSEFPPTSSTTTTTTSDSLKRTTLVLQNAMAFLEEELRFLLEDSKVPLPDHADSDHQRIAKNSSFNSELVKESDRSCISQLQVEPDESVGEDDDFPGYSPETVMKMSRIVSTMISGGYEKECCQTFSISRRTIFNEQLKKLDCEKLNTEDVWKMSWESLETEIKRWIKIVKNCSKTLFPAEKQLGETVFAENTSISTSIFSNLARAVVIQLLDFAGAVSTSKRSAEKLFKFLDMYDSLLDLIPAITHSCSDDCEHELRSEIASAAERLGEAARNIFLDLENSIKNDAAKTAVPGGAVHPLTRYVLNYLKYACEYKDTLEKIFEKNAKLKSKQSLSDHPNFGSDSESPHNLDNQGSTTTVFSMQLVTLMDLLDANIEAKSMLYKDPSLRYIFLMNNGRYILQKVKGSSEIHQVMGDNWYRRRSTVVRQFHKNYQRETWVRLLHCLSHEGLLVNGKVNKPMLKERFKNFNTMFDEIHKMQSTWVVSDDQLRTELRVSIAAVVIPAYRSFLGRFRQYLDSSKQSDKYIKYQPEDIETLIEELFDGNPTSMVRRRT